MNVDEINIAGEKLRFSSDGNEWCNVSLIFNGEQIELGAETWTNLKERLLYAFSSECTSLEPEWILSLSEKHCSFYRQSINGINVFFWNNAVSKELWRSEIDMQQSKEELEGIA